MEYIIRQHDRQFNCYICIEMMYVKTEIKTEYLANFKTHRSDPK